jgi:hypothetical protein
MDERLPESNSAAVINTMLACPADRLRVAFVTPLQRIKGIQRVTQY